MLKPLNLSVDDFSAEEETNVKILAFKDLNSDKYYLVQKEYSEDESDFVYYMEANDQKNSCYGGIRMIQIYDDKIIFNIISEQRKQLGFRSVHIELNGVDTEITEHEIYGFFGKSGIPIKNYLGVKLPNKINIKVQSLNSNLQLDYNISNMSDEEYQQLSKEAKEEDFEDYSGPFQAYLTWQGIETILYVGEKYDAEELAEHRKKYHPPCTESTPYLLDDGRVLLLNVLGASFFDDEYSYLQMVKSWPKIEEED